MKTWHASAALWLQFNAALKALLCFQANVTESLTNLAKRVLLRFLRIHFSQWQAFTSKLCFIRVQHWFGQYSKYWYLVNAMCIYLTCDLDCNSYFFLRRKVFFSKNKNKCAKKSFLFQTKARTSAKKRAKNQQKEIQKLRVKNSFSQNISVWYVIISWQRTAKRDEQGERTTYIFHLILQMQNSCLIIALTHFDVKRHHQL